MHFIPCALCSGGGKGLASQWLAQAGADRRGGRDGASPPPIPLRTLLTPGATLTDSGAEALTQLIADLREPVRRVIKALAAKSAIPLIPFIAAAAAWRRVVGQYSAAAPLATELDGIAQEATKELEARQARVLACCAASMRRQGNQLLNGEASDATL